mmetsp:Transcript_60065/g.139915  ORF Transcript_60065/g.139915 Transcript_60065/m.139915 type:complete len:535 (+) Transcript_60065:91-1695(+)
MLCSAESEDGGQSGPDADPQCGSGGKVLVWLGLAGLLLLSSLCGAWVGYEAGFVTSDWRGPGLRLPHRGVEVRQSRGEDREATRRPRDAAVGKGSQGGGSVSPAHSWQDDTSVVTGSEDTQRTVAGTWRDAGVHQVSPSEERHRHSGSLGGSGAYPAKGGTEELLRPPEPGSTTGLLDSTRSASTLEPSTSGPSLREPLQPVPPAGLRPPTQPSEKPQPPLPWGRPAADALSSTTATATTTKSSSSHEQGTPALLVKEISEDRIEQDNEKWRKCQDAWHKEEKELRDNFGQNATVLYMYRAQGDEDYKPVNINTADLPGVLWYLHNEIVRVTPRKNKVTRILRYKVTVKNTLQVQVLGGFGNYVAFDSGRCSVPGCGAIWTQNGYVVGCQVIGSTLAHYTRTDPCQGTCQAGHWYSLPGPCPQLAFNLKDAACMAAEPGGECNSPTVTGTADCTYHVEEAGQVDVNEFSLINNYSKFVTEGRREWDPTLDRGMGYSFWDGMRDHKRCVWRMNRLQMMFKDKYPDLPALLDAPKC